MGEVPTVSVLSSDSDSVAILAEGDLVRLQNLALLLFVTHACATTNSNLTQDLHVDLVGRCRFDFDRANVYIDNEFAARRHGERLLQVVFRCGSDTFDRRGEGAN